MQLESYARSIDVFDGKVLLGLRNGKIVELDEERVLKVHMNCHFAGETYGLCYDKWSRSIISAGDDNKILTFSLKELKVSSEREISS